MKADFFPLVSHLRVNVELSDFSERDKIEMFKALMKELGIDEEIRNSPIKDEIFDLMQKRFLFVK